MIIRLRAARAPLLSAVFILALTDTTVARADVPTPEPWMGEMDPTSRSCPKLNRDRGEPFVYHCVRASIGVIENTEPFAPGPYEDKEDPDWAKIAPYFRTGKLLYIQSEDCDDGVSAFMARGGAQQNSSIAENEAEKKFNRALQEKFRELTFRKKDFALHCVAIEGEGEDVLISAQAAPAAATSDDNNDDDTPGDTSSATSSESDAASESAASDTMPDGIARFVITSKDRQSVGLRFFSQSRKHSWPGDDKYWTLSHGDERTYDLKCQPGEKICYGAWREDYADVAWGAAKYGKSGCERCCTVCGKRIERNLVDGGATPSNRLVFVVHNNDRYKLGIEFYSQTRQRIAWPGGNKQYNLGSEGVYSLTCKPGEKICYGAWRDYQTIYWGAGKGGRQACRNCCGTCGGRTVEVTLRHGGPDSFPRTSGGGGSTAASDGIDALTAIIGGFAQGYAAGSAYNRGGGGGSPAPVPRGVNRRQSDITR